MAGRVTILIGGTGFVGRQFVAAWNRGRQGALRVLVHRSRPAWLGDADLDVREVDLDDAAMLEDALSGGDVAVNLLRPDGTGWLASALPRLIRALVGAGVRRIVHAGSIDVYGRCGVRLVDETTPLCPLTPYEREHCELERILSSAAIPATVVRLGAVFGPGGKNLLSLVDEVSSAPVWKPVLRRSLNGRRRMHLLAVRNAVAAIGLCVARDQAAGGIFVVTDDEAPANEFTAVQARIALALGRELPSSPILPEVFLRLALRARGRSDTDPCRRYSSAKITAFGYLPAVSFADALDSYCRNIGGARSGSGP